MISWPILFIPFLTVFANNCFCTEENTLQLVMAVFRHGDRTNDKMTVYPRDPYINYTYYPFGYGQLTNVGKQKMYDLGKILRKKYNKFIDKVYTPNLLYATSTDTSRTKVSLKLVLAGLFPPFSTELEWNNHLNWSPIPFTHNNEITHRPPFMYCPEYRKLHQAYIETDEVQIKLNEYKKWYPYLTYHTGLNVESMLQLILVHGHLVIQEQIGMKVPLWSFPLFPHITGKATKDFLNTLGATPELRQFYGGIFLKKLIQVMKDKINGTLHPSERKLFLYSGHDLNVMSTLGALNVDVNEHATYGSCIMLELHKRKEEYFVRIFYEDHTSDVLRPLIVGGCTQDCPFDQFLKLLKHNLPVGDLLCDGNITKNLYEVS